MNDRTLTSNERTEVERLRDTVEQLRQEIGRLKAESRPSHETCEQRHKFEADGSRKWYADAWKDRVTFHEPDKVYVRAELLEAAIGFLKRARNFTPLPEFGDAHSLSTEIDAFLIGSPSEKAVEQPSPVDDAEFGTAEWRAANPESERDQRE